MTNGSASDRMAYEIDYSPLFSRTALKPNSGMYYFAEVSGHNLESSQT
jgi:hypothetical protein